jgi:hypothetical protein
MSESRLTVEAIDDPAEIARHQEHWARAQSNWDWLRDHWADIVPRGYGKFLAIAGQEAFLADTLEEALSWARTTHPEDTGRIVEYLLPPRGPRCYAHSG